jgi:hypothetical protein
MHSDTTFNDTRSFCTLYLYHRQNILGHGCIANTFWCIHSPLFNSQNTKTYEEIMYNPGFVFIYIFPWGKNSSRLRHRYEQKSV